MQRFSGPALFLDRVDINTDEIIPARYLTALDKATLRPHLLVDLTLEGFDPRRDLPGKRVIVARDNFGCGSSREHAPWALEANAIHLVLAPSFARIFRRNMYNNGMLAVELPAAVIDHLFATYARKATHIQTDLPRGLFTVSNKDHQETIAFAISDFDRTLVEAGGWVDYADARY
jgi:3-isopropylmalate/(R)-2-methylmalate dehydratase small subunit